MRIIVPDAEWSGFPSGAVECGSSPFLLPGSGRVTPQGRGPASAMGKAESTVKPCFFGAMCADKNEYQPQCLHRTMPPRLTASWPCGIAIPPMARLCYGFHGGTSDAFLLASPGRERIGMTETTRTMEPGLSRRSREVAGGRSRLAVAVPPRAQPLIAPAPRSAMFFPLVVLVAVLPGMVALNSWDLTPPGPLWGLRAPWRCWTVWPSTKFPRRSRSSRSESRRHFEPFRSSPLSTPGWPRSE